MRKPSKRNQANDRMAVEMGPAVERLELHQETGADDVATQLANQIYRRGNRASRCEQIIDHQDASTLGDAVAMDLEGVGAVFQLVFRAQRLGGKLAELADGHEPYAQEIGQRCRENESAGLHAHYRVRV